jgi:hypothetical protein
VNKLRLTSLALLVSVLGASAQLIQSPSSPAIAGVANGGTAVASLPVCLLGSSTDLSVANTTDTKLTIWSRTSTGSYDPGNMYASGVVTVPLAGVYEIEAGCATDNNGSTTIMKLFVNGSAYLNRLAKINGQQSISLNLRIKLNANDTLAIYAWQNSGGAIYFYGADNSAHFSNESHEDTRGSSDPLLVRRASRMRRHDPG